MVRRFWLPIRGALIGGVKIEIPAHSAVLLEQKRSVNSQHRGADRLVQANSVLQTARKFSEGLPQMMPKILVHLSEDSEKSHKNIGEKTRNND